VAAADPPASPDPTIITEYFRLFAGFTSFISNLCRVHFCSMGPDGLLAFNSMTLHPPYLSRSQPASTAMGSAANPSTTTSVNAVASRRATD